MSEASPSLSRRERNRINTAAEIKDRARAQMESEGAAALSLRAIAREMGMTAPAIYRYFPSRDDLVTALIVDAYHSLADALDEADAPFDRDDLNGRLFAIARAYRAWAFAHRAEYSLIFGTPIISYHAPYEVTKPAAYRATVPLVDVIMRAVRRADADPGQNSDMYTGLSALDDDVRHAVIATWATMHGLVSLELFGHAEKIEAATDAPLRCRDRLARPSPWNRTSIFRQREHPLGRFRLGQRVVRPTSDQVAGANCGARRPSSTIRRSLGNRKATPIVSRATIACELIAAGIP